MKKLLLVAAIAALTTSAHAGGCDEETIRGVARGGSVVADRRLVAPESRGWTYCPCFVSIIKRKAIRFGDFCHLRARQLRTVIARTAERPNQCHPISIWA
jgi:hypothetical protein